MKGILLCGICFLAATLMVAAVNLESAATDFFAQRVAYTITKRFIHKLEDQMKSDELLNGNLRSPLLPPIADPATLDPLDLAIDLPIPGLTVTGKVAFETACVSGLSKLTDDFALTGVGSVKATWNMELPMVSLETNYFMDLLLEMTDTEHSIDGSGPLGASVDNVFFNFEANGRIPVVLTNPIRLETLDVDLGFSNLQLSLDNSNIDNSPIDWQELATYVETLFHNIWGGPIRGIVTEIVRCSIDHVVNDCTPGHLLRNDTSCLKLEINVDCFTIGLNTITDEQDLEFFPTEFLPPSALRQSDFCAAETTPTSEPGQDSSTTTPGPDPGDSTTTPATGGSTSTPAPGEDDPTTTGKSNSPVGNNVATVANIVIIIAMVLILL